jgi:hypothetical protein
VEDNEIALLEDFLHRFGWTLEPLLFHENGIVYAHCQLPALRAAGATGQGFGGYMPAVPERDAATRGG